MSNNSASSSEQGRSFLQENPGAASIFVAIPAGNMLIDLCVDHLPAAESMGRFAETTVAVSLIIGAYELVSRALKNRRSQ